MDKNKQRPSVPSSSGTTVSSSGRLGERAEGAKNLWVRTGCHWNLKIGTYNTRSLSTDVRVTELQEELEKIKFDVVGVCEARRKGEGCTVLNNTGP